MTPEQKVALDAMRSAWPEEVVQRMLRAEDGEIEAALLLNERPVLIGPVQRLDDGGSCVECGAWRAGHLDENADHEDDCAYLLARAAVRKRARVAAERIPIPPPETATGVPAPRPPSPHAGMALYPDPSSWRCSTCGYHACICDSFPGAGAG